MRWLLTEMWIYLAIAFALGMAAYRWAFGAGGGLSAEDVNAELASVRTRHQEWENERAKLRSKIVELTSQLDDAKREGRSAHAEAHAARAEANAAKSAAAIAARAKPEPQPEPEPDASPASETAPDSAPKPAPAPAAEAVRAPEPGAMPAPAPSGTGDDLTRIKGVGAKLAATLNGMGITSYRQIAEWSDEKVAEMDALVRPPGRINRDDWRGQARRLMGEEG